MRSVIIRKRNNLINIVLLFLLIILQIIKYSLHKNKKMGLYVSELILINMINLKETYFIKVLFCFLIWKSVYFHQLIIRCT